MRSYDSKHQIFVAGCPPFNLGLSCPFGKKADSKGCPLSICSEYKNYIKLFTFLFKVFYDRLAYNLILAKISNKYFSNKIAYFGSCIINKLILKLSIQIFLNI